MIEMNNNFKLRTKKIKQQDIKITTGNDLFKIKQIMDVMINNVTTNIDISTLKAYVPYAVKFNADNIRTGMVPGDVEMCNGVSLYIANERKTKALVNELFPSTTSSEDEATTNTTK